MPSMIEVHTRDDWQTTVIAMGTALSAALDFGGKRLYAIQLPSAWTAANLTFQTGIGADVASATFANMFLNGAEYTITAAASETLITPFADFIGARYLKIRSGTTGTPVQQAANRTLVIQLVA